MVKRQKKYLFLVAVVLIVAVALSGAFILSLVSTSKTTLDQEYYGTSEQIDLEKEDYERMIKQGKSFVVISYASVCNSQILDFVETFSGENNIAFNFINWAKLRETDAAETIKYPPTVFIVEKGKIRAYLDSDSDEDTEKYNNYEAFSAWLKENLSL